MDTSGWSVSDVVHYLQQIGLGQYSDAFIKNNIEGSVLPDLNEGKLRELGIQSIGHRIKLMRFINSIKSNEETSTSPKRLPVITEQVNKQKVDTNSIHPLHESDHYHIFVKQTENESQNNDSAKVPMKECKICHHKIPITFYDHHEKSCKNVFIQCQREYQRRGINLTDNDIVDLLNGKVPIHHVKLEKCHYCGKKFSPSTFLKHESQCKKKMSSIKTPSNKSTSRSNSNDFKKNHQELIDLIRAQKKEKMYQIFFTENSFPVVKVEATEVF